MRNNILKRPILLLFSLSFVFAQCKMDDKAVPEKEEIQSEESEKITVPKAEMTEDTVSQGEQVIEKVKKPTPPPPPAPLPEPYPDRRPEPWPDPRILPPPVPEPIPTPKGDEVVSFPETEPEFPGGIKKLVQFINENLEYPQIDIDQGYQGRVYLTFIVEEDGSITNTEVKRGISTTLDKEAKRLVALMPKWTPATLHGKPCRSKYSLPITFRLE